MEWWIHVNRRERGEKGNAMTINGHDVSNEEWAVRAKALDPNEKARMLQAASVLLSQPEAISDPHETELYILQDLLGGTVAA
jgi:ribosomal 30S subunit maturation factor RimM